MVEKDLALNIAKKVQYFLGERNVTIHMTRTTDTFIGLSERAQMANDYGADLFVSFHQNNGGGKGFESYIYPGLRNSYTGAVQDKMHESIIKFYESYGLQNRGKQEANFAVLRETIMPAILLENLFLASESGTRHLKNSSFVQELSSIIAKGILKAME